MVRGRSSGGLPPVRGRGRGGPRRVVRDGQPDRASRSASSSAAGAEVEVSQLHEHVQETPPAVPVAPVPTPPVAAAQIPHLPELAGVIAQAVAAAVVAAPGLQQRAVDVDKNFERARKLGATEFQGTTDPIQAGGWFQRIEKVFALMRCPDEQKLDIATFLLEGRAQHWWRSYTSRQPQGAAVTWDDFRREFHQQYYPEVYQDQKRREFLSLTQGRLSVADYEAKFTELSQFAPVFVADERERCRLFQDGLRLEIKAKTSMQNFLSFADLVQGAMRAEEIEREFFSRRQERGKRSAPGSFMSTGGTQPVKRVAEVGHPSQGFRAPVVSGRESVAHSSPTQGPRRLVPGFPPQPATSRVSGGETQHRPGKGAVSVPLCDRCRKHHFGECRMGTRGCYICGQLDHQKKNCPRNPQSRGPPHGAASSRGYPVRGDQAGAATSAQQMRTSPGGPEVASSQPRAEARVFAVTRQEAPATPDVISGKFLICDYEAYALIDPGSTHSFVSIEFSKHVHQ